MLTGQLVMNGPVLPLLIGPMWLTQFRSESSEHPVLFLSMLPFGFVLAWCWWSVSVSAWRWWALRYRDMSPAELQWRGASAQRRRLDAWTKQRHARQTGRQERDRDEFGLGELHPMQRELDVDADLFDQQPFRAGQHHVQ